MLLTQLRTDLKQQRVVPAIMKNIEADPPATSEYNAKYHETHRRNPLTCPWSSQQQYRNSAER